jgi:uncharacterized membrane protein
VFQSASVRPLMGMESPETTCRGLIAATVCGHGPGWGSCILRTAIRSLPRLDETEAGDLTWVVRRTRLASIVRRGALAFAVILSCGLFTSNVSRAQTPDPTASEPTTISPGSDAVEWHRTLEKSISYQTIVVATDQLLYFMIVTGTPSTELGFLAANAATGVVYYVLFDETWRAVEPKSDVASVDTSVTKAIAYRVFDTARVLGVSLAIGTTLSGSVAVTAASAAVRTGVYMLHEYAWSLVSNRR